MLVGYDVCYRREPSLFEPIDTVDSEDEAISNMRTVVKRGIYFFDKYGPTISGELTFDGGYTKKVTAGDGDLVTKETVWDFKVSKKDPTENHTLQILMYYLMGIHSEHAAKFERFENLGLFNPRLNRAYLLNIKKIPEEVIKKVSRDVIGY
jgi:hypothetical protein